MWVFVLPPELLGSCQLLRRFVSEGCWIKCVPLTRKTLEGRCEGVAIHFRPDVGYNSGLGADESGIVPIERWDFMVASIDFPDRHLDWCALEEMNDFPSCYSGVPGSFLVSIRKFWSRDTGESKQCS